MMHMLEWKLIFKKCHSVVTYHFIHILVQLSSY
jgi:hypothetical protein